MAAFIVDRYPSEDRDSGKWKLDPEETQKRRELFYEILTYDMWQVLFSPSLSEVHCLMLTLPMVEPNVWPPTVARYRPYRQQAPK